MQRCFFVFLIIILFAFPTCAQTALWDKVDSLERQSLPQSALEVVNQIYQNAFKSGNSPELIKSMIYRLKYETAIDNDRLPEQIREIEQFAGADQNPVEQAILYSMLAKIYSDYYRENQYVINQRTDIVGNTPDDMREWSKAGFLQKISGLIDQSLRPAEKLQQTGIAEYKILILGNESSEKLRPTLYDFLTYRGIDILWNFSIEQRMQILNLYQNLLDFRRALAQKTPTYDDRRAALLVELDQLSFSYADRDSTYIKELQDLEQQYEKEDFCVEILYQEALVYKRNPDFIETPTLTESGLPVYTGNDIRAANKEKAYNLCLKGIQQYPNYERIGLLKNLLNDLTSSYFSVSSDNAVYPGKNLELKVNYQNVNRFTVEIYRINAPESTYLDSWSKGGQYKKRGVLVDKREAFASHSKDGVNAFPYLAFDMTIPIQVNELGIYEYVIYADSDKNEPANQQFSVSRLATVARATGNRREILVVDRMSGKPVEGANIHFYTRKNNTLQYDPKQSIATDKLGLAVGGARKDLNAFGASIGNDTALITSPLPWFSTYRENEQSSIRLNLLTDRSIYRPGQTVYFKGIAVESGKNIHQAAAHKTYTIIFRDANYKEIAHQKLTTNEFGSLNGEFVIPQGRLNGNFSIASDAGNGSASIRVEEYKRPAFDIHFDKNEQTYRFGDEITIQGNAKTFSGINLQEVPVQYNITRRQHWLYRHYFSPVQVADGTVQTRADGSFEIRFTAEKAPEDQKRDNVFYTYVIEATVTDSNGETQSSQTRLYLGDKSMYLTISGLNQKMEKEAIPEIKLNAFNLQDNPVAVQGSYEIYSLQARDKTKFDLEENDWTQDKPIQSGNFESGSVWNANKLKTLDSGRYRIRVKATDDKGREIETQQDFTLFSNKDKKPPVPVYVWLTTPKTVCATGEKAEIVFGSSVKEAYVLYELLKNNTKIATSRFVLNNENKKIEIPFLESYGGGVVAVFSFVKDGKFFTEQVEITQKQEPKDLQLNLDVFRDYLLPGQKEEWKISIKDAHKNPVLAELLAGMYDASLDKIKPHSWYFSPVRPVALRIPGFQTGNEFGTSDDSFYKEQESIEIPDFTHDSFNWFGFSLRHTALSRARDAADIRARTYIANESPVNDVLMGKVAGIVATEGTADQQEMEEEEETEEIQIRQNFNETAFFYPQLKTNEAGETLLSFTVPESNTTWKFMGLAHTPDLKY